MKKKIECYKFFDVLALLLSVYLSATINKISLTILETIQRRKLGGLITRCATYKRENRND